MVSGGAGVGSTKVSVFYVLSWQKQGCLSESGKYAQLFFSSPCAQHLQLYAHDSALIQQEHGSYRFSSSSILEHRTARQGGPEASRVLHLVGMANHPPEPTAFLGSASMERLVGRK